MQGKEIIQQAQQAIRSIRGQHVILDFEVAEIYGVETRRLNQQVKRNQGKFPEDFHFQLTQDEFDDLISQNVTSSSWGGRRKLPFAFTEHGVLQAANVLSSDFANSISVFVIRAFIEMREVMDLQHGINTRKTQLKQKPESERKLSRFMKDIGPKLQKTVANIMDTVIDPAKGTTIGQEGQDIISESIAHLKARLQKTGLENEEIAARITKILAEAEHERAMAKKTRAETEQLEFMTMVKKLKLVLEAQRLLQPEDENEQDTRRIDVFIKMLKEHNNQ